MRDLVLGLGALAHVLMNYALAQPPPQAFLSPLADAKSTDPPQTTFQACNLAAAEGAEGCPEGSICLPQSAEVKTLGLSAQLEALELGGMW